MALSDSAFKAVLLGIFDAMSSAASGSPKNNEWYAGELAKAIDDQVKTADVLPGIAVAGDTASGGALVGAATSAKGKIE